MAMYPASEADTDGRQVRGHSCRISASRAEIIFRFARQVVWWLFSGGLFIGNHPNFDELVKSRFIPISVIPAEAGIQSFRAVLDPGVRRGDDMKDLLQLLHLYRIFESGGVTCAFITGNRAAGPGGRPSGSPAWRRRCGL
jgi:hypothetical protein